MERQGKGEELLLPEKGGGKLADRVVVPTGSPSPERERGRSFSCLAENKRFINALVL